MKKIIGLLLIILAISIGKVLGDIPKQNQTMPPKVRDAFKKISAHYSQNNLAQIIRRRKELRLKGVINQSNQRQYASFIKVPLLIGRYSNSANSYTKQEIQNKIFENNPDGTMVEYYQEVSAGQLNLSGQVDGWYNAPQEKAFYVGDNNGMDGGGARFVLDIVKKADPSIDFSQFDYDGDGYVDCVIAIHTGGDGASGQNNIWSHNWSFSAANYNYPYIMPQAEYTTNDPWPGHPGQYIKVNDYTIQPEEAYDQSLIDIGVFCHEFGHALGLPDLYDYDYSSNGVGNFCLMAGGCSGGDGIHPEKPVHMCAWAKYELGWISPINITSDRIDVQIPNIEQNPNSVYRIWKDGSIETQYFLLENRQRLGFDKYLAGTGLFIWHIDEYILNNFQSRGPNDDENHKGVDLEEADGRNDLDYFINFNSGDDGDPYPGSSLNRIFNGDSNPSSRDYNGNNTGVEISEIYQTGQLITANLKIGKEGSNSLNPPQNLTASVSGNRVLLNWQPPMNSSLSYLKSNFDDAHVFKVPARSYSTDQRDNINIG
ncbi:MAG: M6 family metalloprotease domain-containing protein, partial [Candidatus Lokiarchaeota archaeon]|nr:M6 family metalloprotease domain-containing protein [Candidatus Lokiarchaeota archaeon]